MPSKASPETSHVSLRVRKARSIASMRIQSLARAGADDGHLTPREVKEVCLAVVAEGERQSAAALHEVDAKS